MLSLTPSPWIGLALSPMEGRAPLSQIGLFLRDEDLPQLLVLGRALSPVALQAARQAVAVVQGRWQQLLFALKENYDHPGGSALLQRMADAIDRPEQEGRRFELAVLMRASARSPSLASFCSILLKTAQERNPPLAEELEKEALHLACPWVPLSILEKECPEWLEELRGAEDWGRGWSAKKFFVRFSSHSPSDEAWREVLLYLLGKAEEWGDGRLLESWIEGIRWIYEYKSEIVHSLSGRVVVAIVSWEARLAVREKRGTPLPSRPQETAAEKVQIPPLLGKGPWGRAFRHPLFDPSVLFDVLPFLTHEEFSAFHALLRVGGEGGWRVGGSVPFGEALQREMRRKIRALIDPILVEDPLQMIMRLSEYGRLAEKCHRQIQRSSPADRWYLLHMGQIALHLGKRGEEFLIIPLCRMFQLSQLSLIEEFLADPRLGPFIAQAPKRHLIPVLEEGIAKGLLPPLLALFEKHGRLTENIVELFLFCSLSARKEVEREALVKAASSIEHPSPLLQALLFFEAILSSREERIRALAASEAVQPALEIGATLIVLQPGPEVFGTFASNYLKEKFPELA